MQQVTWGVAWRTQTGSGGTLGKVVSGERNQPLLGAETGTDRQVWSRVSHRQGTRICCMVSRPSDALWFAAGSFDAFPRRHSPQPESSPSGKSATFTHATPRKGGTGATFRAPRMTTRYAVVGVQLRRFRRSLTCFGKQLLDLAGHPAEIATVLFLVVGGLVTIAAHQAQIHEPFVADALIRLVVDF